MSPTDRERRLAEALARNHIEDKHGVCIHCDARVQREPGSEAHDPGCIVRVARAALSSSDPSATGEERRWTRAEVDAVLLRVEGEFVSDDRSIGARAAIAMVRAALND